MKMQKMLRVCLGLMACVGMVVVMSACSKDSDQATPTSSEKTTLESEALQVGNAAVSYRSGTSTTNIGTDSSGTSGTADAGNVVLTDPLTNGQTVGAVFAGEFTPEGYKVTTNWGGYLAYSTDILRNIRVEFDAKGYISGELDGEHGKMVVIQIFDSPHEVSWMGGSSAWYTNCIYELRKKGARYSDVDGVHLRFDSPGQGEEYRSSDGHSPAGHPLEWDANTTYHWVFTIKDNQTTITRNGQIIFDVPCHEFDPQYPLNVRIGGTWFGRSGPRNVTYSNVKISRL